MVTTRGATKRGAAQEAAARIRETVHRTPAAAPRRRQQQPSTGGKAPRHLTMRSSSAASKRSASRRSAPYGHVPRKSPRIAKRVLLTKRKAKTIMESVLPLRRLHSIAEHAIHRGGRHLQIGRDTLEVVRSIAMALISSAIEYDVEQARIDGLKRVTQIRHMENERA